MILWAARRAAGVITVCEALRTRLIELGGESALIHTLRNGVDLARFRPRNRDDARRRFGFDRTVPVLLSVGHLIERKGHHLVIEALARLPAATLLVAPFELPAFEPPPCGSCCPEAPLPAVVPPPPAPPSFGRGSAHALVTKPAKITATPSAVMALVLPWPWSFCAKVICESTLVSRFR